MKLRYTRRAFADRREIFDWLADKSPTGAGSVIARLDAGVNQLLTQPMTGYATDVPNVRVLFVGRYPYKIFYRVRDDTIEVLHIRHTSRRLPDNL